MKNRFLVALATAGLLACSTASFANFNTDCGIYVGGQLGWGQTDYGFSTLRDISLDGVFIFREAGLDTIDEDGGVAGRIYLGYQFNPYIGVEIGAALFSDVDFPFGLGSLETSQFDALLKVGMPFGCSCFRGDIKAGIAAVHTEFDSGDDCHRRFSSDWDSQRDRLDNTEAKFALGASLTYSINRCVAVDLSYLHVFGSDFDFRDQFSDNRCHNNDNLAPTTDLVTFGVSYMFL